uniref:GJ11255 putative n=1 Tax=Albugo laibachii Nc14 TaxID=890382 RepID=F0WL20_9STRA|nr:GJ11255 putative [Albugo laibachii Nc14]|eukprot:CCA21979.1 GJ11255 putative [Albugo laibachii Nc14]
MFESSFSRYTYPIKSKHHCKPRTKNVTAQNTTLTQVPMATETDIIASSSADTYKRVDSIESVSSHDSVSGGSSEESLEPENEDELMKLKSATKRSASPSCEKSTVEVVSKCKENASESDNSSQSLEAVDAESIAEESHTSETTDEREERDSIIDVTQNQANQNPIDILSNAISDEDKVVVESKSAISESVETKDDREISTMARNDKKSASSDSDGRGEIQAINGTESKKVVVASTNVQEAPQGASHEKQSDNERIKASNDDESLTQRTEEGDLEGPNDKAKRDIKSSNVLRITQRFGGNVFKAIGMERENKDTHKRPESLTNVSTYAPKEKPDTSPKDPTIRSIKSVEEIPTATPIVPQNSPQSDRADRETDESIIGSLCGMAQRVMHQQSIPKEELQTASKDGKSSEDVTREEAHDLPSPYHDISVGHPHEQSDSQLQLQYKQNELQVEVPYEQSQSQVEVPHEQSQSQVEVPHEQSSSQVEVAHEQTDPQPVCVPSDQSLAITDSNENDIRTCTPNTTTGYPQAEKAIETTSKADSVPQTNSTLSPSKAKVNNSAQTHQTTTATHPIRSITEHSSDISVNDAFNDENSTDPSSSVRSSAVEEENYKDTSNETLNAQTAPSGFQAIMSKFEPKANSPEEAVNLSKSDPMHFRVFSSHPKPSENAQEIETGNTNTQSTGDTSAEPVPIESSCGVQNPIGIAEAVHDIERMQSPDKASLKAEIFAKETSQDETSCSPPASTLSEETLTHNALIDPNSETLEPTEDPQAPLPTSKSTSGSSTRASRALIKKSKHASPFTLWLRNTFSKPFFGKLKFSKRKSDARI